MRPHVWMILGVGALLAADAAPDKAVLKDVERLQGTWTLVSGSSDGKPLPKEFIKDVRLVVDGYRMSIPTRGVFWYEAIYKLYPTRKPKAIDLTIATGLDEGKIRFGIYRLEDDRLTIALPYLGKERPKDFSPGLGVDIAVWQRSKR